MLDGYKEFIRVQCIISDSMTLQHLESSHGMYRRPALKNLSLTHFSIY